jgi:hypothetical protein
MMLSFAVLTTALLFGGMVLYSFGFAAFLFTALPAQTAGATLRQWLMPAINRATDAGQRQRFKWLHSLSVLATLGHIVATGWLLARII